MPALDLRTWTRDPRLAGRSPLEVMQLVAEMQALGFSEADVELELVRARAPEEGR